ncbi:MAG: hemolysin III family protein [Halofilum sp. (in: g-proteobacteria)]
MSANREAAARAQSFSEEVANSACHGLGLVGALVGTPFLLVSAARHGDAAFIVGASVFCAAMILLYSASALYHALPHGPLKRLFFVLDHSAIFLLIAGTYTPFTLGVLRETAGWQLFAGVWTLALVGLTLRALGRGTRPLITTALYLAMGWLVLFRLDAMIAAVPPAGLAWLVAGGLAYTLGVVFFVLDARIRYGHAIWHAFVVGGTACHYFAVLWYAAPAPS